MRPPPETLDVRSEQHVGLPDLITSFCFELLVRWPRQQLAGSQAALFEEALQGGGRDGGRVGT